MYKLCKFHLGMYLFYPRNKIELKSNFNSLSKKKKIEEQKKNTKMKTSSLKIITFKKIKIYVLQRGWRINSFLFFGK